MNNPMPDVTVIVPTRNEAGNVAVVADRVAAALWGARPGASARLDWELVFVDDSDDETVAVLAGLAAVTPPVSVVHRAVEERVAGLSGAVLAGLAVTTSRWVAVMDADLQHPPELLGDLLDPVVCGRADVAIASRYCAGRRGGATGRWGRVVSGGARSTVRMAFPRVRPVSDPLGGFFAFDRAVVEGVHLRPEGFKILLEVLVRGRWSRVAEVPYNAAMRTTGRSKAGLSEHTRFARHVARLWLAAGETQLSGDVDLRGGRPGAHEGPAEPGARPAHRPTSAA